MQLSLNKNWQTRPTKTRQYRKKSTRLISMAIVTAMATASIAAATKLKRKQQHEASVHPDAFL